MGYGQLCDIPALNGLRWNTPGLIRTAVRGNIFEPGPGFSALWERLAKGLDVRLSTTILRAQKTSAGFEVETDQGTETVEHLVITTPLEDCSWVELPAAALDYARATRWRDYVTTLVVAKDWFREDNSRFYETNTIASGGSRVGHMIAARRTGDKVPGLDPHRADAYVTYQYADRSLSDERLIERLREDIRADGGEVTKVVIQKRWQYCPTLSREAIAAGAMWRIDEAQGRDGLWFSGASLSHESAINVANFNRRLARRIESALKSRRTADVPPRAAARA